jgi:acetolactate synthase-1/3 small subunit
MGRHTISVLVENHPGVLSKVAGLFSRRGYNIHSLTVGTTENPEVSRMTIVVNGDNAVIEQVDKQLSKLIDVLFVKELETSNSVRRELALVKVNTSRETRAEIMQIVEIFRANIVDISENTLTVEISGGTDKVNALIDMLYGFGIKELVKTGAIALNRGSESLNT